MTTKIVGLFKDTHNVNKAVQLLKSLGLDSSQISLRPSRQFITNLESELRTAKSEVTAGIAVGAASGATLGLLIGLMWGLSAIILPSGDAVLVPNNLMTVLTSSAAGLGIGAVAGSLLLAGLAQMGLNAQNNGDEKVLMAVQTPDERVLEVKNALQQSALETSIES